MDERRLGSRGPRVCPIGYGAFKIGRNRGMKYVTGYDLPDDAEADRLLNGVLDLGIDYIDTAPAYGLSEERIGRAIGHRREEFTLSTKVGEFFDGERSHYDYSVAAVERSLMNSLRQLRTDVLDLVFVHSDGNDRAIQTETDVIPTLLRLREAGVIHAVGFSGKTMDGARAALAWADCLMLEYHLGDRSQAGMIADAATAGVGVVVKKPLASGRLPAGPALEFVLETPGVSAAVVGSLKLEHLRECSSAISSNRCDQR